MAIMYALVLLMAVSILCAAAQKVPAERVFPCLMLSVMGIIYPFYCFDRLKAGVLLAYGLILLTGAVSVLCITGRKRPLIRSILATLTPGIFIFAAFCGFVFVYTRHNLVGLWDEMRLWGAVPKALYATGTLQLGDTALIFDSMQPYPPGMPLLVYFMEYLSPSFSEGYVFIVYGIFFGAMLLPALQSLKWKQCPAFLPLLVLLMVAPCIFTSHGGDDGWFYESLFIDPILGVLAGYAFWLSAQRPFDSLFQSWSFAAALLALTIVKDSGALFAVFAAVNALVLYLLTEKERRNSQGLFLGLISTVLTIALGYGLWRWVLGTYGIGSNESGFMKMELSLESLEVLWTKLLEMPMVNIQEPLLHGQIVLTYLPCLLGMMLLFRLCGRARKGDGKRLTWAMMLLSFLVFLIGYRLSFRGSLPSFQRYVSATLICAMGCGLIQSLPGALENAFRAKRKWVVIFLCLFFVVSGFRYMGQWQKKKYDMEYTRAPARTAVTKIKNTVEGTVEEPADIYVLIADKPRQKSLIHHRIYYELIGTNACVRNFWNDVNIVGGEETPTEWTREEIAEYADRWVEKLCSSGYDYVYVAVTNDFAAAVLAELGITEAVNGDLYAVLSLDGVLRLEKV